MDVDDALRARCERHRQQRIEDDRIDDRGARDVANRTRELGLRGGGRA